MIYESYSGNNDKFSEIDFQKIIKEFNLTPDFILSRDDDKIIINEIWSSEDTSVSVDRIYEFDIYFSDCISELIKKNVLVEILDILVEEERYEEASEVRDIISSI